MLCIFCYVSELGNI
ncbi:hypothetical protein, partial [Plasmodium yoelii yoelii]